MNINLIEAHSTDFSITFKNPALQDCTIEIKSILDSAVKYANDKNREIAKILGKVKTGKLYEADGFKSVDEYAEVAFGIKRANAYALAAAGEVYNDEKAPKVLQDMSYSKLAELARADKDKVSKAIEEGKLSSDMTQKDIRELVTNELSTTSDKPKKAEVIPTYKVRILDIWWDLEEPYKDTIADMEYWDAQLAQAVCDGPGMAPTDPEHGEIMYDKSFRKAEIIKLPKCQPYFAPTQDKKPVIRKLYVTDKHSLTVEFYEAKVPSLEKDATVDYTSLSKEQLMEILASAQKALTEKDSKKSKKSKK